MRASTRVGVGPIVRDGEVVGTWVRHGGRVFELPQYPKRVKDVVPNDDGTLTVHFEAGHSRILEPEDAAA